MKTYTTIMRVICPHCHIPHEVVARTRPLIPQEKTQLPDDGAAPFVASYTREAEGAILKGSDGDLLNGDGSPVNFMSDKEFFSTFPIKRPRGRPRRYLPRTK